MLDTRSIASIVPRVSAREGIHNDVHAEARVIDRGEALVVRVIVPLGTVVLVAVQHRDTVAAHHRLQVLVNEVVPPPVEFMTRRRRPVIELEKRCIQLVRIRKIDRLSETSLHFFERSLVKHAADVVVVIVDENHPATIHQPSCISPLSFGKAKRHVAREIHKRIVEYPL